MFDSNNEIIKTKVPQFVSVINAAKATLGMHHNRTDPPRKSTYKLKSENGEIVRISIVLTKGEVMSHKGVGGRGAENRVKKEFYNPYAEPFVEELANEIAANSGNVICGNLCIA